MKRETMHALHGINRRFYDRYADAFDHTRTRPWQGWSRLLGVALQALDEREIEHRPLSVLDAGCGNGRFALFLGENLDRPFRYLGIDASDGLLDAARARTDSTGDARLQEARFLRRDLLESDTAVDGMGANEFQLVAAFGLLHHVASFSARRELIATMCRALAPGGVLLLSFWQFAEPEFLRRRSLPWDTYNEETQPAVDPLDLEPGDHLLRWGDLSGAGPDRCRYCHHTDPEEARRLFAGLGLDLLVEFEDDSASRNRNLYVGLGKGS